MAEAKSLRHEKPFNANEQDSPAQGKFKKTPLVFFFYKPDASVHANLTLNIFKKIPA